MWAISHQIPYSGGGGTPSSTTCIRPSLTPHYLFITWLWKKRKQKPLSERNYSLRIHHASWDKPQAATIEREVFSNVACLKRIRPTWMQMQMNEINITDLSFWQLNPWFHELIIPNSLMIKFGAWDIQAFLAIHHGKHLTSGTLSELFFKNYSSFTVCCHGCKAWGQCGKE